MENILPINKIDYNQMTSDRQEFFDVVTKYLPKLGYGCAYCGSPKFKSVRLQVIEDSKYVDCVNWCPDCEREDWVAVDPTHLGIFAVILSSGR